MSTREPGMFALVLHSHLPWLANHGRWPVGEAAKASTSAHSLSASASAMAAAER